MPYKDPLKRKERNKTYYQEHKEGMNEYNREYRRLRPWVTHHNSAQQRCQYTKNKDFGRYGGKGVKFLLSMMEMKALWFRDKAFNMRTPSIDRKDSNGDYVFQNCRFVEQAVNCQRLRAA